MTYARSRLWLGISGVGLQVVAASAALWFALPHRLLRGVPAPVAIAATLACSIGLSLPSDVLGGYFLPRQHGRSELKFARFLAGWLRGVLLQALIIGVCAAALLMAGRWAGVWAGVACFAGLMLLLLAAQAAVAQMVGGLSRVETAGPGVEEAGVPDSARDAAVRRPVGTMVLRSTDPGFVGGVVGLPGRERMVFPSVWLQELPPEVLSTERVRRNGVLATGARTRGLAAALAWNLLGFLLACHLPGASLADAPGLIQTGLWFTLWSFLGLLLLPSVNRPGVLEADRFALAQGISSAVLSRTISCLDRLQDDEPARGRWVERIFHPIPSVESRVAAFSRERSPYGAWQGARVALYLAWGCFGFLSRAVHCNAGRPELWVLFPGD